MATPQMQNAAMSEALAAEEPMVAGPPAAAGPEMAAMPGIPPELAAIAKALGLDLNDPNALAVLMQILGAGAGGPMGPMAGAPQAPQGPPPGGPPGMLPMAGPQ